MSKCDVCLFEKGGECYSMIECENFNLFYPVIEKAQKKIYEVRLAGPKLKVNEKVEKEEKKYMKTWEAIKALEEGKKIRRKYWAKDYRLEKDKDDDIIECYPNEGLYDLADNVIDSCDLKANDWEIYEEPKEEIKNCCKVCAYRYKLQTGDIMCCKKVEDTKDSNYCGEFVYNEPSNDYVKAMIKLLEVVKGV